MIKVEVTSAKVSKKLKELNVNEPSRFFRDWTGSKEKEVEEFRGYKKYYGVDNINCYTLKELSEILIKYATERQAKKDSRKEANA